MSSVVSQFNEVIHAKVIIAFLCEGKSHRRIQEEILNIPAPSRGGGFVTMQILHYYMIDVSKKGILQDNSLTEEMNRATGMYKKALELVKQYR